MTDQPPESPGTLTRLRTDLAGPRGAKRVDALLSAPDPEAAVAALAAPELYELVTQVGLGETFDLIALATPEQIRGCLDIDIWDRDRALVEPMRPWLAALMEAGGHEKLGAVWSALDSELRALFIQKHAVIYDLSLGEEPDDDDGTAELYFTPDTYFCLKLQGDEETRKLIRQMMDDLYRYEIDGVLARHSIMAARSEPAPELEDMAYRWRSGRMADLGYVDFHDALDLFQPLEPEKVTIGEGTEERYAIVDESDASAARLPAAIADELLSRSFLARALDRLDAGEADRLKAAILVLTNKVLSAARIKPGDLEALRRGAHYATATLSMGLEVVARGDVERAAAALRSISVTRLHRVGYTVTLKIARLARGLAPRAATAGEPATAVLAALLALRPWMSRALDQPPATGVRPFESPADLRRAAEVLARLGLRIAIAEALGVDLLAMAQAPEPRPALDDHARTALVHAMLGEPARGDALDDAALRRFRATCFAGESLSDEAQERALAALTRRLDDSGLTAAREPLPALVAGWLGDLERGFAPLSAENIDGRFVEGVVTAAARS
jgi:hypothetical protein